MGLTAEARKGRASTGDPGRGCPYYNRPSADRLRVRTSDRSPWHDRAAGHGVRHPHSAPGRKVSTARLLVSPGRADRLTNIVALKDAGGRSRATTAEGDRPEAPDDFEVYSGDSPDEPAAASPSACGRRRSGVEHALVPHRTTYAMLNAWAARRHRRDPGVPDQSSSARELRVRDRQRSDAPNPVQPKVDDADVLGHAGRGHARLADGAQLPSALDEQPPVSVYERLVASRGSEVR